MNTEGRAVILSLRSGELLFDFFEKLFQGFRVALKLFGPVCCLPFEGRNSNSLGVDLVGESFHDLICSRSFCDLFSTWCGDSRGIKKDFFTASGLFDQPCMLVLRNTEKLRKRARFFTPRPRRSCLVSKGRRVKPMHSVMRDFGFPNAFAMDSWLV